MKRVVYQIDPNRRNPDGSFPDFTFEGYNQKYNYKKWLHKLYLKLYYHAEKRNIHFGLRFRSFLNFCRNTNYHALRGRGSNDLAMDRKNNLKGYLAKNIQALTHADNNRKYWIKDRKRGEEGGN